MERMSSEIDFLFNVVKCGVGLAVHWIIASFFMTINVISFVRNQLQNYFGGKVKIKNERVLISVCIFSIVLALCLFQVSSV